MSNQLQTAFLIKSEPENTTVGEKSNNRAAGGGETAEAKVLTRAEELQHEANGALKKVYIETFGCQMNKADSENMLGLLEEIGYQQTSEIKDADLMVLNTCAIREGAEDKVYSYLGHWNRVKRPGLGQ